MDLKKPKRKTDEEFIQWIKRFSCLVCNYWPTDAAHVISRGANGDDVGNVVSLCRACHTTQHAIGIKTFCQRYNVDLEKKAGEYAELYRKQSDSNASSNESTDW